MKSLLIVAMMAGAVGTGWAGDNVVILNMAGGVNYGNGGILYSKDKNLILNAVATHWIDKNGDLVPMKNPTWVKVPGGFGYYEDRN